MTCGACKHWKPGKSGPMAPLGAAVCALDKPWRFFPPQARCQRFLAAAPAAVAARSRLVGGVA